jgi:hypothetical protein
MSEHCIFRSTLTTCLSVMITQWMTLCDLELLILIKRSLTVQPTVINSSLMPYYYEVAAIHPSELWAFMENIQEVNDLYR